jgi:transposase
MTDLRVVMVGVDAHTDTHDAAVLDDCGRLFETQTFTANAAGYGELLGWARRFGVVSVRGGESTGSYAAGLLVVAAMPARQRRRTHSASS